MFSVRTASGYPHKRVTICVPIFTSDLECSKSTESNLKIPRRETMPMYMISLSPPGAGGLSGLGDIMFFDRMNKTEGELDI